MSDLLGLLSNYVLITALIGWASAQVLKTIINFMTTGKFDMERLVGAGGMPSCHSACVCALALAVSRKLGFASPEFAIAFIFAVVVMYDAMGVRLSLIHISLLSLERMQREEAAMSTHPLETL